MNNTDLKRRIPLFNGEKFSVWKFRMRGLFEEKDLLRVIDDVPPQRVSADWEKANRAARNLIIEYLSDSLLSFVKPELTAKEILDNMSSLYERKSFATQMVLRTQLSQLKLSADTTLIKHFIRFDEIIEQLLAAGATIEEPERIIYLLLTLPNSYSGIITALETLSDNELSLPFVKTRLLDQETKLASRSRSE